MPSYAFRCKNCGQEFDLFYKSTAAYAKATPRCTHCNSVALDRLITQVSVKAVKRDYRRMSSNEMLGVLESGDEKQVREMYRQVGAGTSPEQAATIHEQAQNHSKPDKG